jgi:hypothetical protein
MDFFFPVPVLCKPGRLRVKDSRVDFEDVTLIEVDGKVGEEAGFKEPVVLVSYDNCEIEATRLTYSA